MPDKRIEQIKIAIVDDHPMILEGFRMLFQNYPHYVTHSLSSGAETLLFLEQNSVDVILLDINLADSNGIDLCREIKKKYPKTLILGFSNQTEQSLLLQFIQNGGNGYILKNANVEEIIKQIDKALNGELALCSNSLQIITSTPITASIPRLTKREKQILHAIAEANTSAQIAEMLFISAVTVETHRRNLLQKFQAKNTVELIRKAIDFKLIE